MKVEALRSFEVSIATVGPRYNDVGVYDISPIESDVLWYEQFVLTITLYSSVITTFVYNDTVFSPFHNVITELDSISQ
jgi:hypothetical protein